MTRQRQKQEGKRKGYGKFLPVRTRETLLNRDISDLIPPELLRRASDEAWAEFDQLYVSCTDPIDRRFIRSTPAGIRGLRDGRKFTTVEQMIESALKAAGKEGR